jgi:hypothetical protein
VYNLSEEEGNPHAFLATLAFAHLLDWIHTRIFQSNL